MAHFKPGSYQTAGQLLALQIQLETVSFQPIPRSMYNSWGGNTGNQVIFDSDYESLEDTSKALANALKCHFDVVRGFQSVAATKDLPDKIETAKQWQKYASYMVTRLHASDRGSSNGKKIVALSSFLDMQYKELNDDLRSNGSPQGPKERFKTAVLVAIATSKYKSLWDGLKAEENLCRNGLEDHKDVMDYLDGLYQAYNLHTQYY